MYNCENKYGVIRQTTWKYINKAWVAAITVCYSELQPHHVDIPDATGLELSADGNEITITWTANNNYLTQIQYKNDDGEWITLPLIGIGVGEV
jgi:hypothetical protein